MSADGQKALLDAMHRAIDIALAEWDLTFIEIIGCLESLKADVFDTSEEQHKENED